jgi:hypothetical protein
MKASIRFTLVSLLVIVSCPLFSQYWSENFEGYTTVDKSLKYGYNWKNATTATGIKSIEARSMVTGIISTNTPASFTTGYFLLENKKYTINFQHKSGATIVNPQLKVSLVDINNKEVAGVFTHTYFNNSVQFSSFTINGYTGWFKIRFQFSSTDARETFICGLDNINSTIPVHPETNSSVILSDIQANITVDIPAPDRQILEITFTNLGPDPCFMEPAGGSAILTNLKNVPLTDYTATNLQFDPVTKKITFLTYAAPDSFGVNNQAKLTLTLRQSANTPFLVTVAIDNLSFQIDPTTTNNSASLVYNGSDIPPNWKKIELSNLNKGVHVYWETLIELNAHHYNIQRSDDGMQFNNIGTVLANNSGSNNIYSYNDYAITTGKDYFYRIQLVNNNGASIFSPTHRISIANAASIVKIYPTVLRPGMVVTATVKQPGTYLITLLHANTTFITSLESKTNSNKISIPLLSGLKPGIYYIRIINKTNHDTATQPILLND